MPEFTLYKGVFLKECLINSKILLKNSEFTICKFLYQLSGGFNSAPGSAMDEGKDYQDMICLGRKGGQSLKGRRAQSLSLQGLLLGSFA